MPDTDTLIGLRDACMFLPDTDPIKRRGMQLVLKFVPKCPKSSKDGDRSSETDGYPNRSYGPGLAGLGTKLMQTCKLTLTSIYHPRTISQAQLCQTLILPMLLRTKRFKGHKNLPESLSSLIFQSQDCHVTRHTPRHYNLMLAAICCGKGSFLRCQFSVPQGPKCINTDSLADAA